MGLNLLALGTAIWGTDRAQLGGRCARGAWDLRARSEERLLLGAFGPVYAGYCRRAKRFVPGLY